MTWERLEQLPLHERTFRRLKEALMSGEFGPGERLVVSEIADRLGTSPMPVRDALRRLATMGVVAITPQSASRIVRLSAEDLVEIGEMRKLLEGRAIVLAIDHMTPKMLRNLRSIDGEIRALFDDNLAASIIKNYEFHHAIYQLAGSPLLLEGIESLWLRVGPYLKAAATQPSRNFKVDDYQTHDDILAGLEGGDTDKAAAALQRDIDKGTSLYLSLVDAADGETPRKPRRSAG